MKSLGNLVSFLLVAGLLGACASAEVTSSKSYIGDEKIPRPDRIIVYTFSATPAEVPPNSAIADRVTGHATPQTNQELEVGRKLGASVARNLVAQIRAMGLPATEAAKAPKPKAGDAVIKGHFVSIDEGSVSKRMLVGFGSGAAELRTVVEGYQVTDKGLRPLGSREIDSDGGKTPGVLVPAAVTVATANPVGLVVGGAVKVAGEATGSETLEGAAKRTAKAIAEELKAAFQKQGWI